MGSNGSYWKKYLPSKLFGGDCQGTQKHITRDLYPIGSNRDAIAKKLQEREPGQSLGLLSYKSLPGCFFHPLFHPALLCDVS